MLYNEDMTYNIRKFIQKSPCSKKAPVRNPDLLNDV